MSKHHRHENDCLNCGAELQGHFCHNCGQENMQVKEPFWHFVSHSISHYFHFDEKFFSTLKPLLTQPGFLTQEYLIGRRARYLHPVSMYIFVSVVYFLVIPNLHPKPVKEKDTDAVVNAKLKTEDNKTLKSIADAKKEIKTSALDSSTQKYVLKSLDKIAENTTTLKKTDSLKHSNTVDSLKNAKTKAASVDNDDEEAEPFVMNSKERETYKKTNIGRFASWTRSIWKTIKTPEFKKELEHYQPKLYFILMPLFAFFLMLNFRRNHRYYVEHIVFTIHFFTAFFIFELFVEPLNYFVFHGSSFIGPIKWLAILWYCYTALKVFYDRTKWATIRKMITLSIMLSISFTISYGVIGFIVYMITNNQ